MEYESPIKSGFTVYSKSGCPNCIKVKNLLKDNHLVFKVVDCDDYIINDKDNFLFFIKELSNTSCRVFPMVFNDGKFIGGHIETKIYVDKIMTDFEETLIF